MPSSVVQSAQALVTTGRVSDAEALLDMAGRRDDVDALMQLAVWRLIGEPLGRDLHLARDLLRRAVRIGHVDAALMEVALTANGSGGPVDWPAARRLLEVAASNDPVAADQLALLAAMPVSNFGEPETTPVPQILHQAPSITRLSSLLSRNECSHLASAVLELFSPAHVIDPVSGKRISHPIRSSDDAVIGPAQEDLVIRAINLRIASATATHAAQGEPLTVLRYAPGQQYRPHLDTIAGARNQRTRTVLIYLNDGFTGGETHFPELGITVAPRAGDAIVFDNVLPDGRPDPASRHAGLPVRQGVKWLATRWIRAHPVDPWNMATAS